MKTVQKSIVQREITKEIDAFLIDRQAENCSASTIKNYREKLGFLMRHLSGVPVLTMEQVTTEVLRGYMVELTSHHAPGGVHAYWRTIKTFFRWYEREMEDAGVEWRNPMRRITPPVLPDKKLAPLPAESIQKLLESCDKAGYYKARDRAMICLLYDSGVRRAELVSLDVGDLDMAASTVRVRIAKGRKSRTSFFGNFTRRELSRYLRQREKITDLSALFVTRFDDRITPQGLRQVLRRRGEMAGLGDEPTPHGIRRACAIYLWRAGVRQLAIQLILGHSTSGDVTARYLEISPLDLKAEYRSPVDALGL